MPPCFAPRVLLGGGALVVGVNDPGDQRMAHDVALGELEDGNAFGGAQGAVRLSLGWSTSDADIDRCLEAWQGLAGTLLKGSDETLLERF